MTDIEAAARELSRQVSLLTFSEPVAYVYNPLEYAWKSHARYLRTYGTGKKRIVFVGMNPGPWGMAQTGVPFGEVETVARWLGITDRVQEPEMTHPKKPVLGFECTRSEVSGRRLWGLICDRFGRPEDFFRDQFVSNYCPLLFLDGEGRNITPDKLPADQRRRLFDHCDEHLRRILDLTEPDWIIGIGNFAFARIRSVVDESFGTTSSESSPRCTKILHPSPASPAANRGWADAVTAALTDAGVWRHSK